MFKSSINLIKLNSKFNVFFSYKKSVLYLFGLYGIMVLKMPSLFFFNKFDNKLSLLFINKFFYTSFLKHFLVRYKNLFNIYVINIRVKGLGYRIRKVVNNLYYFFFNYTNMYYFYIPNNILVK